MLFRTCKVVTKFQMKGITKAMPPTFLQTAQVVIEKSNLKIDRFKIG